MGTLSVQPPSGASRSLTEVFVLLRNNAVQSRHIFSEPSGRSEDRMSLVPLHQSDDRDLESGMGFPGNSRIPPEWVNMVDEVQYEMSRIRTRLKELKDYQQKHLVRPSFNDDSSEEERAIAAATQEITKLLAHCQRLLQHIQQTSSPKRRGDKYLLKNVLSSLLQALQQLTVEFRGSQTGYLKQVQNRDDSFQQYFEAFSADSGPTTSQGVGSAVLDYAELDMEALESGEEPRALSMAQIQELEENSTMVKEREREILHVTKSILEINQLFKDLASFVVDQGSVLDRIDFNIEQSNVRVKAGLQSVKKAEQYQKKNRKMMCILILSGVIVFLLLLLIIVKS